MGRLTFSEEIYNTEAGLDERLIRDINAPGTLKIIATVSRDSIVHAVYKDSLYVNESGQLEFYESADSGSGRKDMVWSVWNGSPVVVTILTKDQRSYEIRGTVHPGTAANARFKQSYKKLAESKNTVLPRIWQIDPAAVQSGIRRAGAQRAAG